MILPVVAHVTRYHSVVCLSVCILSVTLVHPAKAVGQNDMPFSRDTHVVASNIVNRQAAVHLREGVMWEF